MTPWRAIYKMLIKYIFFLERKKQDEVNSKLDQIRSPDRAHD